jgi:hypothetical protein
VSCLHTCELFFARFGIALSTSVPTKISPKNRLLTSAEFQHLSAVPPEIEWFANIRNRSTRRAYETAIQDFMGFAGIARPEEFRVVTRAHMLSPGARISRAVS